MTLSRRVLPALTITPLLVAGLAVTATGPATSAPRATAAAAQGESRTFDDTYYSAPPALVETEPAAAVARGADVAGPVAVTARPATRSGVIVRAGSTRLERVTPRILT